MNHPPIAPGTRISSTRPSRYDAPRLVVHLARPPVPVRRSVAGLAARAATTLAAGLREAGHALADAWRGIAL